MYTLPCKDTHFSETNAKYYVN